MFGREAELEPETALVDFSAANLSRNDDDDDDDDCGGGAPPDFS